MPKSKTETSNILPAGVYRQLTGLVDRDEREETLDDLTFSYMILRQAVERGYRLQLTVPSD